jgi:glycosyltransferase involved in cell wall biosynthesis
MTGDSAMRPRILFVGTANVQTNATQVKIYYLAGHLAKIGHDVTLMTVDCPENRRFLGDSAPNLKLMFIEDGSALSEWWRKVRAVAGGDWDIVQVVGFGLRTYVLFGRPLRHPKIIYDYDEWMSKHLSHRPGYRTYYRVLEWLTRRQAHGVVVASRALEKVIRTIRPGIGPNLLYLPIGVDADELAGGRHLDDGLAARWGDRAKFIYIGSVDRNYQVWELIDLAEACRRQGFDYRFIVVGGGAHLSAFTHEISERGLDPVFAIEGQKPRSDLGAYLRVADALVFPFPPTEQNLYRCPSKIFQYIAANKPVVTNRVGEVAEALGEQGFYYEPGNVDDMLRACREALGAAAGYKTDHNAHRLTWDARCETYRRWLEQFWQASR